MAGPKVVRSMVRWDSGPRQPRKPANISRQTKDSGNELDSRHSSRGVEYLCGQACFMAAIEHKMRATSRRGRKLAAHPPSGSAGVGGVKVFHCQRRNIFA